MKLKNEEKIERVLDRERDEKSGRETAPNGRRGQVLVCRSTPFVLLVACIGSMYQAFYTV